MISTGSPNLTMAMARIAMFLDKARRILDQPSDRLRTVEASELDVQAVHTICVELVRLRELEKMVRGA